MRPALFLAACATAGGLIGLTIGMRAAQILGILLALAIIVIIAIAPTHNH